MSPEQEGKYIYCIIETKTERNFGPIGIGGRGDEVTTLSHRDLSMVISNSPMTKFVVSQENLLAHERVVEEVMREFTALPVRFCTIASSVDEVRNLLDRRYREFRNLLKDMDHKVELGVKGLWKNMAPIYDEIVKENQPIERLREKSRPRSGKKKALGLETRVEMGRLVEEALQRKKDEEGEMICEALRGTVVDFRRNRTLGDEMFLNAAFLVDKGREKEFDNIMEDLNEGYQERIRFMYTGPLPAYNFVNLTIYSEEWEK
jgi:hypothetical protein